MGTSLTGLTPATTYDALIKVGDNGPLSATAKVLSDGLGNDSVLALSTTSVGIGTTTPSTKLHLNGGNMTIGGVSYPALILNSDASGIDFSVYSASSNDYLGISNGTSDIAVFKSSGNVGIGTTSPTGTYGKLTVQGTGITLGADGEGKVEIGRYSAGAQNSYIKIGSTSTSLRITNSADQYDIFVIENNTTGEKLRLLQGGGITFNGDTSQANALDDYEEGTFTPSIAFGGGSTGVTYFDRQGNYTKIGRQVTCTIYLAVTAKGSSTGVATMTGLPFTASNLNRGMASGCSFRFDNVTYSGQFQMGIGQNSSSIDFFQTTELGADSQLTDANFNNSSEFQITATYFV